jgi:hypothetical protein
MRFAPESNHGANAGEGDSRECRDRPRPSCSSGLPYRHTGLDKARAKLEPIKQKFPAITYSDLWVRMATVKQDSASLTWFLCLFRLLPGLQRSKRWVDPTSRGAPEGRTATLRTAPPMAVFPTETRARIASLLSPRFRPHALC